MTNHEIVSSALQKYYSALKSLQTFGEGNDFFDDVSCLDKFFSEFRNITFVIQKCLKTDEEKKKYDELREKYLMNEEMKWFVDVRNKTTKQQPFRLQISLVFDVYMPTGLYRITDDSFSITIEERVDKLLKTIKEVFSNRFGEKELFFSAKIIFNENDSEVEFYPKLKFGLIQMNKFIKEFEANSPCDCSVCSTLKEKTAELFNKALFKDVKFTNDYYWGEELSVGEKSGIYFSFDSNFVAPSEMRVPLNDGFFGEVKDCPIMLFKKFASSHIMIYRMQQHQIMPVFMVVYADDTFAMIPFIATTKTTFFRKVREIVNRPEFNDITMVFLCGEFFLYDSKQWADIQNQFYSKRTQMAQKEKLMFIMMMRGMEEETVMDFDTEKIDDDDYVGERFQKKAFEDTIHMNWLQPIKEAFSPKYNGQQA